MAARRILVTGAASGIGAACARLLAGPGNALALHTRKNRDGADRVAAHLREHGGTATVLLGDLAQAGEPERAVEEAAAALGGLDVVIANAGFADRTPLSQLTDEAFAYSHASIAFALLRLARAAKPHLAKGEQPRLVAVSSFVAHVFRLEQPLFPASAAAKAGLEALVKALAIEWAPEITVNAVAPGFTRKDPGAHAAMDPKAFQDRVSRIPMRRLGETEEVAAAILFLASPAAGYVTGQVLHVDGGITA
ncbi:SDR family NAD(P)-dependent oxidoreductase [Paracraurococcus ruber]|uniref:Short-chain dehydrogenase n=1 Tax=Paracraurococcus ruber TaxID=77675 RepID=A0ABS1CS18_9PROT|nr:SDR family oxidoreductase [Paracraurococcus ruber]MBK1657153.1 short-chain dehydrogenase [Paracraurococcus ruber]TDG31136.1 SDR family oxidoreductase [Paracraurococcus ruber]